MSNESQYYGYPVSHQAKAEKQLDDSMKDSRIADIKQKLINDPDVMHEAMKKANPAPFDDCRLVQYMQWYFESDRLETKHAAMNAFFSTLTKRIDDYMQSEAEKQVEE